MTVSTTLEVITTSLNTSTPSGATSPVSTLVVGIGPEANSGMVAYASQTFSIVSPTSDDLANYAVGKSVVQTIAPAPAPAPASTSNSSSTAPASSSTSTAPTSS